MATAGTWADEVLWYMLAASATETGDGHVDFRSTVVGVSLSRCTNRSALTASMDAGCVGPLDVRVYLTHGGHVPLGVPDSSAWSVSHCRVPDWASAT
jgi:hypothetical protein